MANTCKKFLNTATIILLFFIKITLVFSEAQYFEKLILDDDLTNSTIRSITQDHTGFMWFSTDNGGIVRYDGYEFYVYKHDGDNKKSLTSNYTTVIYTDSRGRLWVGTSGDGLNVFDHEQQLFQNYQFPIQHNQRTEAVGVNDVIEGKNGIMWIASRNHGLIRFDTQDNTYKHFLHDENDPHSILSNHINTIFFDHLGRLWIGTNNGLNVFDPKSGLFENYQELIKKEGQLSSNRVTAITQDENHILWVGTEDGLNRIDINENRIVQRYYQSESNGLVHNYIRHLLIDSRNQLWISTVEGISVIDQSGRVVIENHLQFNEQDTQYPKSVFSCYEDKDRHIWCGAYNGGLYRYHSETRTFKYLNKDEEGLGLSGSNIYGVAEDEAGNLWIGSSDNGLSQYSPETQIIKHFLHNTNNKNKSNKNSLSHHSVGRIIKGSEGGLWIGTFGGGLNYLDIPTGIFTCYQHSTNNKNTLSDNYITSLLEDSKGHIWVGTLYAGLNRLDPKSGSVKRYRHDPSDAMSIASDQIWQTIEHPNGNILVGTGNAGLSILNTRNGQFTHLQHAETDHNILSHNAITDLHFQSKDVLWVATTKGLNRVNLSTKAINRFYTTNGLPSDSITSITNGIGTDLWIGTMMGISKLNTNELSFSNFDVQDGLPSNFYNAAATFTAKDKTIYMGNDKGLIFFQPEDIESESQPPSVVITKFMLSNKAVGIKNSNDAGVTAGANSFTLSKSIGYTDSIELAYYHRLFSFDFAALNYVKTNKTKYAYQLKGWDKGWIETNYKNRRATYTNIPHGEYIFQVRASNGYGLWNEEPTEIRIIIKPPVWDTYWAYSIYILLILLFIYSMYHYIDTKNKSSQNIKDLIREKQYNQKLNALDKLKDEFLANTSHELRTPLNGIIGISETLLERTDSEICKSAKEDLDTVIASAKRLSHLVNDILDFSKLKNNEIELYVKDVDLFSIVNLVIAVTKTLLGNKPVDIINSISVDFPFILADENRLQQILFNLVGNAIKFTNRGRIIVNVENKNSMAFISISDTGIGISHDRIDSIFESFEQVDKDVGRNYGGTGLGLTVTKQLIELHNGRIFVESKLEQGSVFTFSLPMSSTLKNKNRLPYAKQVQPLDYVGVNSDLDENEHTLSNKLPKNPSNEKIYYILVVDDEAINRQVARGYLHDSCYYVDEASSGLQALEMIENKKYDLVLLDIMMPVMTGFDVCERIRLKYNRNILPVIFLTAKSQIEDITHSFLVGGSDYLIKPINKKELIVRTETQLQLKESYEEIAANRNLIMDKNKTIEKLLDKKNEVFANISHELKTPITLIQGPIQQILERLAHSADVELLTIAEKNIQRLDFLVDQLLQLSRANYMKTENKCIISLSQVVNLIANSFKNIAASERISFNINIEENINILAIPNTLESLLINLLSNAFKYTKEKGCIYLDVKQAQNSALIMVRDTGIGIPDDQLHNIFNRFVCLESDMESNIQGIGIGLALVNELVKLHGGHIDVKSKLGKGSEFTVSLPCVKNKTLDKKESSLSTDSIKQLHYFENLYNRANKKKAEQQSEMAIATEIAQNSKLLIVDDNEEMRAYLDALLTDKYLLMHARDGLEGLKIAVNEVPDIIILDVMMKGMSGFEVLDKLRKDFKTSHIPILMLTAKDDQESKILGLTKLADDYVTKPFDPYELKARLQGILTIRMLQQQQLQQLITQPDSSLNDKWIQSDLNEKEKVFIERFEKILNENYADELFTIDKLSKCMHVSDRSLQYKIKALFGKTPNEYLREFRLNKAKDLIQGEDMSISELATAAGFSNKSYFHKCFKAYVGCTPKNYLHRKRQCE